MCNNFHHHFKDATHRHPEVNHEEKEMTCQFHHVLNWEMEFSKHPIPEEIHNGTLKFSLSLNTN